MNKEDSLLLETMKRDQIVFDWIEKEKQRQITGIELIASENYTSKQVLEAQGSIFTNKYAEGLPEKRYYGGCEFVDKVEQLAIDRVKELFGAVWANVQPHSGAQANASVMLALLKPGDKILGFNLAHGGHLTHGSSVNFSGKLYQPFFYGVVRETGFVDYDEMERVALAEKPKLMICGASSYSRDWDYQRIREIADKINALVLADISHPSGLIAKKLLNNPLEYCHVVTTTTHKTLRGPRGGLIMIGKDFDNPMGYTAAKGRVKAFSEILDSGVFPGTQGGPLEHVIAGKAIAFNQALEGEFTDYIKQVQKNAQGLSSSFLNLGYGIISGGTDNHLMLIDLHNKGISGKSAEEALGKSGITVNKNMVPFDDQSPTITSGIRIGTPAITTRGLKEKDMAQIAYWIDQAIIKAKDDKFLEKQKLEIESFMSGFPLFEGE